MDRQIEREGETERDVGNVGHFGLGLFRPYILTMDISFRPRKMPKVDISAITIICGLGCVHAKMCEAFLGNTCLNNHIHVCYISPKFLSVIKLHVFTSRDENSVSPDQLGSWLIWICSVLKK